MTFAVIQCVLNGIIRHEIVHQNELLDEEDGRPVWRGSVVGIASDTHSAGLLADYHADLAEQRRQEDFARSERDRLIDHLGSGAGLLMGRLAVQGMFKIALDDARGFRGPAGLIAFQNWWIRLGCHCTPGYVCVHPDGYHRLDCPIYGVPKS